MCGIAVAINWDEAENTVRRMALAIAHRGDVTDPVALPRHNTAMCTRRLRIVDADHGEQPQASFDGQILVSLNGEIYNHKELRRELEQAGVAFRTHCDTEVLANALRAWGAAGVKKLSGMFAFVALDMRNGEFLAARDPFGVKPLYVIQDGASFLFCSEIKPLLEATPAGDVMLVPPGHILTRGICAKYFALPNSEAGRTSSPAELDAILENAVACRLPDGLPAALLFSGGIDSTLVAHYARRHRPDMAAYFVGAKAAPDAAFAAAYAEQSKMDLRMVPLDIEGPDGLALMESVVQTIEAFEPVVVRPGLSAYLVSRQIHQDGFRVALCGEGADELFAGYAYLEKAFTIDPAAGRAVQTQSLDLMHRANLQRVDRCGMRFELEIREPLLDTALASYAMRLEPSSLLRLVDGGLRGKQSLRDIYDLYPAELPIMIRDRQKIAFDAGSGVDAGGAAWRDVFEQAISEADLKNGQKEFAEFELATREELFNLRALARAMDVRRVPHIKSRLRIYMPAAHPAAGLAAA
jgi:asparagine synthase (glutamine-hydrolysing)